MAEKTSYTYAPEVEEIANALIPRFHTPLRDCEVRMVYLFRDKTPHRGGAEVWGEVKRITGLNAFLANSREEDVQDFFCILISEPVWNRMTKRQRMALIDHELSHCYAAEDEEGRITLTCLPHDLEEFAHIVERYGAWRDSVQRLLDAGQRGQTALEFEAPSANLDEGDHRATVVAPARSNGHGAASVETLSGVGR